MSEAQTGDLPLPPTLQMTQPVARGIHLSELPFLGFKNTRTSARLFPMSQSCGITRTGAQPAVSCPGVVALAALAGKQLDGQRACATPASA